MVALLSFFCNTEEDIEDTWDPDRPRKGSDGLERFDERFRVELTSDSELEVVEDEAGEDMGMKETLIGKGILRRASRIGSVNR